MKRPPPQSVEDYLAGLPTTVRGALKALRATIKTVVPNAEEVISYQIPTFQHNGALVAYAAFQGQCSLLVISKAVMATYAAELTGYKTSGVTIQFSVDHPLPTALVKKIVRARVAENDARRDQPKPDWPKLSNPAHRALQAAGYTHLAQLTKVSEADVSRLHGMGPKALEELRLALKAKGLSFANTEAAKKTRIQNTPQAKVTINKTKKAQHAPRKKTAR